MTTTTIKRPPLRYYGGKWRIAPWIIQHLPPHYHYIEPCGGGGAVLLRKSRSKLETYNDLDGDVVNFFQVMRDHADELIRKIELTPWSRVEYKQHAEIVDDPIERARRFWIGCNMSISSMAMTASGMRVNKNRKSSPGRVPAKVHMNESHLYAVAQRLIGVQIENLPYNELIPRYDHTEIPLMCRGHAAILAPTHTNGIATNIIKRLNFCTTAKAWW